MSSCANDLEGRVVAAVRDAFTSSPLKKSVSLAHNVLAAFVVVDCAGDGATVPQDVYVIGMGSGTRSVGFAKLSCDGTEGDRLLQWRKHRLLTLDDGHAEVMARRAMHVYLLSEMEDLLANTSVAAKELAPPLRERLSPIVYDASKTRFVWKNTVTLHLVVTQVPCGALGVTPSVPIWSTGAHVLLDAPQRSCCMVAGETCPPLPLPARGAKRHMGHAVSLVMDEALHLLQDVPRTKPGAGTPSLSMSCSDKIVRWMCEGVEGKCLGGLIGGRMRPTVLHIGRHKQPNSASDCVDATLWEKDVEQTLQRVTFSAAGHPPPKIAWFDASSFTPTHAGGDSTGNSNDSCSTSTWPVVVNVAPAPLTSSSSGVPPAAISNCYHWAYCSINTKDGVPHGMTRARFSACVATAAAPVAEDAARLQTLCAVVKRAATARHSIHHDPPSYGESQDVPLTLEDQRRLCSFGMGAAAPTLRWSIGIRAACVLQRLMAISSPSPTCVSPQDVAAARADCVLCLPPVTEVRHPYFAFSHDRDSRHARDCSTAHKELIHHQRRWVNKWSAVPVDAL